MDFGNIFEEFLGERKINERNNKKIVLNPDEYQELKEKAEAYDELLKKAERILKENEKLKKEIEELMKIKEQAEQYYKKFLRIAAEFDNYKKRVEKDKANYHFYATENILKKLIGHYEDLMRGINILKQMNLNDSVKKGFEMILSNFENLLAQEGVKPMNCVGDIFDPYKHEVILIEENNELPENTIIEEIEKGYMYKDKVLKPAKVKISKKYEKYNQNLNNN